MTLMLWDLSSHNDAIDWSGATCDGAVVKASEGVGYANPLYGGQLTGARGRGAAGHYHYARPDQTQPGDEADWCLGRLDWRAGEPVALDYETDAAGVDHNAWALAWLARVEARLGFPPMLYTYPDFARRNLSDPRLARYPLWWASYNATMAPPPAPWTSVALWQYAGDARGQPGAGGPVDLNRFAGALDEWRALGTPLAAATTPPGANPGFPGTRPDGTGPVLNGIDWGGSKIETVEVVDVQVRNTEGKRYTRRWVGYQLDPWREIT